MPTCKFPPLRESRFMRFLVRYALLILLLALAPPVMAAEPVRAARLGAAEKAELARIEAYLNGITALRARFFQVGQGGETAEGKFLLARPGRMRFEYDPPNGMLLISTGSDLVVHDADKRETSFFPLSSTPLVFLGKPKISFEGEVTVTGFEQSAGQIAVSLRMSKDAENGELTLIFADKPLSLRQWIVRDAQDRVTRVSLSQIETGISLDKSLFQFVDPYAIGNRDN